MKELSAFTAEQAQHWLGNTANSESPSGLIRAMHTIATEPERTRAAVVKAMRDLARDMREQAWCEWPIVQKHADVIENGANF